MAIQCHILDKNFTRSPLAACEAAHRPEDLTHGAQCAALGDQS
jgi:hypothetical protein